VTLEPPAGDGRPVLGGDDAACLVLEAQRDVRIVLAGPVDADLRRALAACDGVQVLEGPAGEAVAHGAADLAVVERRPLPPLWTGAAIMLLPPEVPGVLRPADEERPAAWRVAADHPLADALYLAPPRVGRIRRYELGAGARLLCGTPEVPLIATWEEGGARRLAVLFPFDKDVTDWPAVAGFPVFWSRALVWLVPERRGMSPPGFSPGDESPGLDAGAFAGARQRAVHRTYRPFDVLAGGAGLAPGEPGFHGEGDRRIGVSFLGSDEGWQAGRGRDDAAGAAEVLRAAAQRAERQGLREAWPVLAALAIAALVARAWVAR
jgi:hypothetical protein